MHPENQVDKKVVTVDPDDDKERLDVFVAKRLGEDYSRTFAKNIIDKRLVTINGKPGKPSYTVKTGDIVAYSLPPAEKHLVEPENIPLNIIYEDALIIVIDKPAGIVVHPGAGNKQGTLVNALLHHCNSLPSAGDELRPGIVHRLDKDTSGLVVVAKTEKALRSLARQFQKRAVKKIYVALVKGNVPLDNGIIDVPLARDAVNRQRMSVCHDKGKNARTLYHVVKRFKEFTMLRIKLETGRTHQIRVHMKHIGHPIIGDKVYGHESSFPRQALHAETLGFSHPETGKFMEFNSEVPDDIMTFIRAGKLVADGK